MIKRIKYLHGLGEPDDFGYPVKIISAVNAGKSLINNNIAQAYKKEKIGELSGVYGDKSIGDPVEVDQLDIECDKQKISIKVFNRALMMMRASEEILRLHRFFGVIERELGK